MTGMDRMNTERCYVLLRPCTFNTLPLRFHSSVRISELMVQKKSSCTACTILELTARREGDLQVDILSRGMASQSKPKAP